MAGTPGKGGRIPKREDQRRRRNKPVVPVSRAAGVVASIPDADPDWHPAAARWFESLKTSGQSVFYQDSDWAAAHVWTGVLSRQLLAPKGPSAVMMQAWAGAASELLTTEGARRRLKIELQVPDDGEGGEDVSFIDVARRRAS